MSADENKKTLSDWLGLQWKPDYSQNRVWGRFLGVAIQLLTITLVLIALGLLIAFAVSVYTAISAGTQITGEAIRNVGLALAAVFGAPFLVWRSFVAQRQTDIAEQSQITDRINKAVENLGATRLLHDAEGKQFTQPNLEVRIGAIYALERIAQDSLRDHVQIMEILTAYVRENAKAEDAKRSPHEVFKELTINTEDSAGLSPEEAFQTYEYRAANPYGWDPTELDHRNLERWARDQLAPREDIRLALQVIGRRSKSQIKQERTSRYQVDLDRSNLQGAKLSGDFDFASFADARLDGATLEGTFRDAQFGMYSERARRGASLQAARCHGIDATRADFSAANLASTFFGGAMLSEAKFILAALDHTNFNGVDAGAADFAYAKADNVFCYQDARFDHSRFYDTRLDEFRGMLEGPTERLWIAGNVDMTSEQEDKYGREGRPVGNEITNRREWGVWQQDPDGYLLPQHRPGQY